MAIQSGCTTAHKVTTADSLPHNWLFQKLTVTEMQAFRDKVLKAHGSPEPWEKLFENLQPSDEIWRWEEPTGSNMYPQPRPHGCCLVRQNKVVYLFQIGTLKWVD